MTASHRQPRQARNTSLAGQALPPAENRASRTTRRAAGSLTPQRVAARPIIKWAGGKRHLAPMLSRFFPPLHPSRRYFEPFIGGAAIFLRLQHPHATLSDTNADLIGMYTVVRDSVEELIATLRLHVNERDHFYSIRAQNPATLTPVERAARMIYLNKTCYNGLYRVNRSGQFNVPFGRYSKPAICDAANLRAASAALQQADLVVGDYETILRAAQPGDFIYFDPPYYPASKTANFTAYTTTAFDEQQQTRLAQTFAHLHETGCYVMQSNSDTPLIRELYGHFHIETVQSSRTINSNIRARGSVNELVIVNYEGVG